MSKSPGSYYNPAVEYVGKTEAMRGRPLLSDAVDFAVKDDDGVHVLRVQFLPPKKGRGKKKGTESVRVKVGGSTFSLAVITPRGSEESYLDAMFEDAEGFKIDCGSDIALHFLRIDMAARCGDEKALDAVACAEWGLCMRRIVRFGGVPS